MLKPDNFIKWFTGEVLIIFALLLTINNYLVNEDITIKADGEGYYDYLPALFIYKDFPCRSEAKSDRDYIRLNKLAFYLQYRGERINKYPCGTAVLLSPFFCFAHLTANSAGSANDGFSRPFQISIFYAALFYLFLALVFARKLLKLYHLSWPNIFLMQFLIVFATSVISYVNFDPAFSHIYSFFAITAFSFFVKAYFNNKQAKHFLWACIFLGLIIIIRQVNVIIILFIPFLAGSLQRLKSGIMYIFQRKTGLFSGILLTSLIAFIQLFLWHYQTGNYFVYSYIGEGFNFLTPKFLKILFSYQKGLFTYAPVLLFALGGCLLLLWKKEFYLFLTWITFFAAITYVFSSWHSWVYGGSFGSRVYVDFYIIFFILFGVLIENVKLWFKLPVITLSLLTVPVSLIQTKQYKEFILHWIAMDRQKYWTVFLKQDARFKGILWKNHYDFNSQTTKIIYSASIPDTRLNANSMKELFVEYSNNIKDFDTVNIIQVLLSNDFNLKQDARTELTIRDTLTDKNIFDYSSPIIHYCENDYCRFQQGEFNYKFSPVKKGNIKRISLKLYSNNMAVETKNIKINFLRYYKVSGQSIP